MNRDEYLPVGYRWTTSREDYMFLIQGRSMPVIAVKDDSGFWVGWAIEL